MKNKYHIAKDGTPKICRAKKNCPLGSVNMHYDNLAQAVKVSDDLNYQLSTFYQTRNFGFAVVGEHIVPTKETASLIHKLNNFSYNIERMEAIMSKTREDLLNQLSKTKQSGLTTEVADLKVVAGSVRKTLDTEAIRQAGLGELYQKTSTVSEHTRISIDEETMTDKQQKRFENFRNSIKNYNGETITLSLSKNGDSVVVDEHTLNALKELKAFKEQIEEAKKIEKEGRAEIERAMKKAEINKVQVGKTVMEIIPQHDRLIIDSAAWKYDKRYESFIQESTVKSTVRLKFY